MEILGIDIGGSGIKAAIVDIIKGELQLIELEFQLQNLQNLKKYLK